MARGRNRKNLYQRRTPAVRPTAPDDPLPAQITRINELARTARATWLSLMGYLAFVGVTLLAVQDVDFFVDARQTQLPLVGVSIPTRQFFIFAPMLGASLGGAGVQGAALRDVDYSDVTITQAQVDTLFYDGSVAFAPDIKRAPGREAALKYPEFYDRWRAWQKQNGFTPE